MDRAIIVIRFLQLKNLCFSPLSGVNSLCLIRCAVFSYTMTVAHGVKSRGLYMIYVSNVSKNVINVTERPNVSLWHR